MAYNPDGITICQNDGIFNDLNHYHMHVIPRYRGQCFADFYSECETEPQKTKSYFEKVMTNIKNALEILKKD